MAPQGAVLWQCRVGAGCRGHKQDNSPNRAGVPQEGVGCQRTTCLALATVSVRNSEVSRTVGCVGLESWKAPLRDVVPPGRGSDRSRRSCRGERERKDRALGPQSSGGKCWALELCPSLCTWSQEPQRVTHLLVASEGLQSHSWPPVLEPPRQPLPAPSEGPPHSRQPFLSGPRHAPATLSAGCPVAPTGGTYRMWQLCPLPYKRRWGAGGQGLPL